MDRGLVLHFGMIVRDLRRAIGWSQRELASRAGVSQALISAIENGRIANLTLATASAVLAATGSRLILDAARPFLGDRQQQRDLGHVRCSTFIARRLRAAGWEVASEVEVGGDRSRGWIDLLAYHPIMRVTLVIEVKTELHDFAALERQVGWYERKAWAAARRLGWRPAMVRSAVLVLATEVNDARLRQILAEVERVLPGRARHLAALIDGSTGPPWIGRSIAMVDPTSRRAAWIRPLWIDGRRTPAPHGDYVAFLARSAPTAR